MKYLKDILEIVGLVLLAVSLIDYARTNPIHQYTAFKGVVFSAIILLIGVLL